MDHRQRHIDNAHETTGLSPAPRAVDHGVDEAAVGTETARSVFSNQSAGKVLASEHSVRRFT